MRYRRVTEGEELEVSRGSVVKRQHQLRTPRLLLRCAALISLTVAVIWALSLFARKDPTESDSTYSAARDQLHQAVVAGDVRSVQLWATSQLLQFSHPQTKRWNQRDVLHAMARLHVDVVQVLLERGAKAS